MAMELWWPHLDAVLFMYERERKTQREIAAAFGVSQTTIHRLFKRAGIKARPDARGER